MDSIQRAKERLGQQAEKIIADGLSLVRSGTKYRCPNIYAHKNNDRNPSMSWDPNAHHFYCFTCKNKIDIYSYYRDHLNYSHQDIMRYLGDDSNGEEMQTRRQKFLAEAGKVEPLTDECRGYVHIRGINDDTIKTFNLQTYQQKIAFPYYKYETLVGYKLRKPMKNPGNPKMTSLTGSKPYLFNVQNIVPGGELVICEGEFDAMIIHQSGYSNVVSVGAGANSTENVIEQAKEFLDRFSILIVVSDNDESGQNMDEAFIKAFGDRAKLIDKKLYTMNDVNEEHAKHGPEKVVGLIESARFKIEGRRDLDKQPYRGISEGVGKYIPTGIISVDYALNDLAPGMTTLVSGRSNGGKTTFMRQVIANAIDKGNKVYLMNGENNPEMYLNELYQSVIGRDDDNYDYVKINKRMKKEPKPIVLDMLKDWHRGKLVMFNKGESKLKNIKDLLAMLEMEIKLNTYDLVVIDNLMSILSVQAAEKNEQQADFMQNLCNLAQVNRVHIVLVLHPNKTYQKGMDMDFEHISGTSDLYNKADNIIAVMREEDKDVIASGIHGKIKVLKNRYYSDLPSVNIFFDVATGLLHELDDEGNALAYSFNWNGKGVQIDGFKEMLKTGTGEA